MTEQSYYNHDQESNTLTCFLPTDIFLSLLQNRLDPSYSSPTGYRDICINLRLVTQETVKWAVETHICELQLIHQSFYVIKV